MEDKRTRLSDKEKFEILLASKRPGFNKEEVMKKYGISKSALSNRTALFGMCHPRHHPPGTSYQDIHHHHHRFKGGHQHKWYQK